MAKSPLPEYDNLSERDRGFNFPEDIGRTHVPKIRDPPPDYTWDYKKYTFNNPKKEDEKDKVKFTKEELQIEAKIIKVQREAETILREINQATEYKKFDKRRNFLYEKLIQFILQLDDLDAINPELRIMRKDHTRKLHEYLKKLEEKTKI